MKILIAHNRYQQAGGEDVAADTEAAGLARFGHEVARFSVDNDAISGLWSQMRAGATSLSNPRSIAGLAKVVADFKPDVVHFHNTFPTLSPGAISWTLRQELPVVQTLHNYRLICASAQLLRDNKPCELCIGANKLPSVVNKCYRGSALGSIVTSGVGAMNKRLYQSHPRHHTLIALSRFAKEKLVEDGFDADRIVIKGNTVPDPGTGTTPRTDRLLFVGRLSSEKGADLLLRIAPYVRGEIDIVGDGPEAPLFVNPPANVTMHGWLQHDRVLEMMRRAAALVVPSRWYEGFPMVIAEALATGTPVLVSALGALSDFVEGGRAGFVIAPDDERAWIEAANTVIERPELRASLGAVGRSAYLSVHALEPNMAQLAAIYGDAIARTGGGG